MDGKTDQVFHYDEQTGTLTPAPGVAPAGLYDVHLVPPGQQARATTFRTEKCPADKNYCLAFGYAVVGGNRVRLTHVHNDVCWPAPFQYDFTHTSGIPVMEYSSWAAPSGGCCGTATADLLIEDRWRDGDGIQWRSTYGCPG